jgi:transcriptional regulator with XRE-family HTH domain
MSMSSQLITAMTPSIEAKKRLSSLLREIRAQQGWSQRELGRQLKVSQNAIRDWEGHRTFPRYEHLCEIAKLGGYSSPHNLCDYLTEEKKLQPRSIDLILKDISALNPEQLKKVVNYAVNRLAMAAEKSSVT